MAVYDKNVNYFGGAQQYADAIKKKKAAGQPLSDQDSANAFRDANPQYFSSNGSSASSSPYANVAPMLASISASRAKPVSVGSYTPTARSVPDRSYFMGSAKEQYEPLRALSQQNTERLYADLRNRLPALLNARGQMAGGLRNAQEQKLTEDQARTSNETDLQYNSQIVALANALQQRAEEGAYRDDQSNFQRWQVANQLGLQAEGMNQSADDRYLANQLAMLQFGAGRTDADRGYGLQERGQDWTEQYGLATLGQNQQKIEQDAQQFAAKLDLDWEGLSQQERQSLRSFANQQEQNRLRGAEIGNQASYQQASLKNQQAEQSARQSQAEQQKLKDAYSFAAEALGIGKVDQLADELITLTPENRQEFDALVQYYMARIDGIVAP